jgi:hypothetical protein
MATTRAALAVVVSPRDAVSAPVNPPALLEIDAAAATLRGHLHRSKLLAYADKVFESTRLIGRDLT